MNSLDLHNKITLLYKGGLNGKDGELISKDCKYQVLNTEKSHLFCEVDNFSSQISTFALTCLSYNDDHDGNMELKLKINTSLNDCEKCLLNHYSERSKLFYYLSNTLNMSYKRVKMFFDDIDAWRAKSLLNLNNLTEDATIDKKELLQKKELNNVIIISSDDDEEEIQVIDKPFLSDSSKEYQDLNKSQSIFLNEILINPNLIDIDINCKLTLNDIIAVHPYAIKNLPLLKENILLPAVIHQYFASDEKDHWSSEILYEAITAKKTVGNESLKIHDLLTAELINQSIKLERNEISINKYYFKIAPIFEIITLQMLTDFLKLKQQQSITKSYPNYRPFMTRALLAMNNKDNCSSSLHHILRTIKIIFSMYKKDIWRLILTELKVETFLLLWRTPENKNMLKIAMINSQQRLNVDLFDQQPHLSDFIEWINVFYYSLSTSLDKLFFSRNYVNFVLKFVDEKNDLNMIPKGLLTCSGCIYLNKLLSINNEEEKNVVSNPITYLEDKLNDVLPYRGVMNKQSFLQILIDYSLKCKYTIKSNNSDIIEKISEPIFNLLFTCLQIDLNMLILFISKLQIDQKTLKTEDIRNINPTVYDFIIKNLNFYSLNDDQKIIFTTKFFSHLKDAYLVIDLANYTSLVKDKSERINANVFILMGKITDILSKVEADDFSFVSQALSQNNSVLYGFWSSIFSDNRALYSKTVGLLYSCFDAEDRITNFYKLLTTNVESNLSIIINILDNLCEKKLFEPCHFAINVVQDLIDAMVLLIKSEFKMEDGEVVPDRLLDKFYKFWAHFWKFIKTLYQTAYSWAHILKIDVLLEFCKNVMDLNRLAVESVVWFERILKNKSKYDLITPILDVLMVLPSWLKLNDEALVDQCINLLVHILDMAHKNWNRNVAKVITYEIFSVANKKDPETGKLKKTLTTEEQRQKLIEVLYEVDSEYVGKLSKKLTKFSQFDPKSRENADIKVISSKALHSGGSSISYALKGSKLKLPSIEKSIKSQTATINDVSSRMKPFAKSTTLLSSKDRAEEQLRLARASNGRVIHPASNNVFNDFSKKQVEISSSSSDDDNDDVADIKAMFGITKATSSKDKKSQKKQGITMVDEFGNEIVKKNKKTGETKVSLEELQKIEKKKMEKRLKVDVNPFYDEILKWNYRNISELPYENFKYQKTKLTYDSVEDYQNTMGPLLLVETWQQINRSKQLESQRVVTIDVTNRVTVGRFFAIFATVPTSIWEKCGFTDSDICGIGCNKSRDNKFINMQSSKNFSNLDIVNYAKIDEVKNTRGDLKEITIKISLSSEIGNFVSPGSFLYLTKVSSVITSEREYSTLYGLQNYNLINSLLSSKIASLIKPNALDLKTTVSSFNVNESQAHAIIGATSAGGVSLVQGPPGTGKSKTIVSMLKFYFEKCKIQFDEMPTNKKRILLCAPSNAAIDELLVRLSLDTKLNLVRIGRKEAVNTKIQHLVLNELIESKLKKPALISIDNNKYKEELKKRDEIKVKIETLKHEPDNTETIKKLNDLRTQLTMCNDTLNIMRKERDSVRETNTVFRRRSEFEKKNLTHKILSEADVVCCTLSGAAQNQLQSLGIYFPTVVVDEACQCTELSALVPLRYGAKQIIMVGDPNQLPPTVISNIASDAKYDESLFSRLIQSGNPYLLNMQYRMHPEISKFPSKQFYHSKLHDGPNMDRLNAKEWHKNPLFEPYKFFSVVDGKEEKSSSLSLSNTKEAEFALELVDNLLKSYPKVSFKNQIGIVSPYKEQVNLIRRLFQQRFGSLINQTVSIETVDSFQGQEKSIMLFSCVRSSDTSNSIGFLRDFRRLNVALTRGKSNMWIIGNSNMLKKDKLWGNLIRDAESRNSIVEADIKLFHESKYSSVITTVNEEDEDVYDIQNLKKNDLKIGIKRALETSSLKNNETNKKLKYSETVTNKTGPKKLKKVSLNNKTAHKSLTDKKIKFLEDGKENEIEKNDRISTQLPEKSVLKSNISSIPGIYIHDANSSQQSELQKESKSNMQKPGMLKGILRNDSKSNKKANLNSVSFIDKPIIKMYRKKEHEDRPFDRVNMTQDDYADDVAMPSSENTYFEKINIDGSSKPKAPVKKNFLDMTKYKKSKHKAVEHDDEQKKEDEEEEDDYELPPKKKHKLSSNDISINNSINNKEEEKKEDKKEDEEDAYVPLSKNLGADKLHKPLKVLVPQVETNQEDDCEDDDYSVALTKWGSSSADSNKGNSLKNNFKKPQGKKSKSKSSASPFIKDPYKMLKLKMKKGNK
ncbi:hypothetical protein QEN19_002446 [Hanseniaspora menglaensis]